MVNKNFPDSKNCTESSIKQKTVTGQELGSIFCVAQKGNLPKLGLILRQVLKNCLFFEKE
jgi:hypothetical protein